MSSISGSSGSFEVKSGKSVFLQDHEVGSVNILAKGMLDVYITPADEAACANGAQSAAHGYKLFSIDQNMFIGANDLFLSNRHSFSYKASMDSIIFSYHVDGLNGIEELFRQKNEYSSYILKSISHLTEQSYTALQKLEMLVRSLEVATDNLCLYFWIMKEKHGFSHEPSHPAFRDSMFRLQELKEEGELLPCCFNEEFLDCSHFEYDYKPSEEIDLVKFNHYKHIQALDPDLKKQLLNSSFAVSQYMCVDSALLLKDILDKTKEVLGVAVKYTELLYSENRDNILDNYLEAASCMGNSIHEPSDMLEVLHYISNIITKLEDTYRNDYCHAPEINLKALKSKLEAAASALKRKTEREIRISVADTPWESIPEELVDSAVKILEYSELPKNRCDAFLNLLTMFRGLKDRLSEEEQARSLRKEITSEFFILYEAVLRKAAAEKNQDKLLHMFLTYGYMDEKLLSPQSLQTLYGISDEAGGEELSVYSMESWLKLIYEKKKDPSVDDFSMDYFDTFREMKKRGEVKDSDKAAYEGNADKRLSYEINKMFKHNHRLCSRSIRTYFPILYEEVIVRGLGKALVTPKMVDTAIRKVLAVDYSAFHREISYFNLKKGIEKEFIMQAVRPDIILMPIYGSSAIMWQEISGRVRNTPGRFIIPIFIDGSIDELLQKLIGEFRWELCKTMQGVAWNDITNKSLTSEYSDYLQFYKKNKELSEEAKEKLSHQIKKHRNVSRQIFASDYMTWLNYESNGILRLNKPARDILYRYCPFPKETREKLLTHPSFAATANQFRNLRAKQAKELESRYGKYVEKKIVLDDAMLETLDFFKNL